MGVCVCVLVLHYTNALMCYILICLIESLRNHPTVVTILFSCSQLLSQMHALLYSQYIHYIRLFNYCVYLDPFGFQLKI